MAVLVEYVSRLFENRPTRHLHIWIGLIKMLFFKYKHLSDS